MGIPFSAQRGYGWFIIHEVIQLKPLLGIAFNSAFNYTKPLAIDGTTES